MTSDLASTGPVRIVTAASLFDGHDAAINIMRRLFQAQGCEVIHLGHDRSVEEVAVAALEEDVQGIAVSSYQGGHVEYFSYLIERLAALGAGHVQVVGGGGGVIVPAEVRLLAERGVRIFTPEDGQTLGLNGMIASVVTACSVDLSLGGPPPLDQLTGGSKAALALWITCLEAGAVSSGDVDALRAVAAGRAQVAPCLGITGTGGSGKSSLTDELLRRFRLDQEGKLLVAVLAVDPTRRRGGGALLGDRIRMGSVGGADVFFRSLATRGAQTEVPVVVADAIAACRAWGADLVIVETPGIGQGDAGLVPFVDVPVYVMTPEFGAASQLEKIDMLDFAEAVVINKFERRGGEDALRDVRRQFARNRGVSTFDGLDALPVFGTIASRFGDDGCDALYHHLRDALAARGMPVVEGILKRPATKASTAHRAVVPASRARSLADVAGSVRGYHAATETLVRAVRRTEHLDTALDVLGDGPGAEQLRAAGAAAAEAVADEARALLTGFAAQAAALSNPDDPSMWRATLSGNLISRVALPRADEPGALLRFLRAENLPGHFPFTAGVFPLKREGEDPARMFAGEGDAARTNRRFHLLSAGQPATRLSTAFDSVTLYGRDPDERPDIYGKVGTSGVSICTLEDMATLYQGFDLCSPTTSVSMTINGPAPTILAMFLNVAIDQQLAAFAATNGRAADPIEAAAVRTRTLTTVRGTVQADILKEDQGQNTCILSTDAALRMMGDIQEWFIANEVRSFYSVSISGYHIAEAGANPISQLAFTLANGFTYVEAYLARGMNIDDFAPNLSFFFSNGMDPEYTVLGRVARRIWSIAMRDHYGANERSQKLKYHVQTSGRSLHAQEMSFNDIRTTLQALCAIYDNANSLHTNAYDEAVTTPGAESVRRALAIQMVITKEWGLAQNENPLQGSFIVDELTDLVEHAVLAELDRLAERGGVLGAMETGYQRGRIQDESMLYEHRKHDGSYPIIGVNTFRNPAGDAVPDTLELARATDEEKHDQLRRRRDFQHRHAADREPALNRLRCAALSGDNTFNVLMDAVRTCTLGEITDALFEVGGRYRRSV